MSFCLLVSLAQLVAALAIGWYLGGLMSESLSFLLGGLIYLLAIVGYSLIYFAPLRARSGVSPGSNMVKAMILAVSYKYAAIIGLTYVFMTQFSFNTNLLFLGLLLNHLCYVPFFMFFARRRDKVGKMAQAANTSPVQGKRFSTT